MAENKSKKQNKEMRGETVKMQALDVAFAQIGKEYGNGAVMLLGQAGIGKVEAISTGSLLIDHAIGVGGFPIGRIIEIFGPESSGKTTLAMHVIAQSQKNGGVCAFIDAEHAMDPSHAERLGIDTQNLIISQPDYGEQALDIAEVLIRSGAVDVIVIDSVAALVPKAELEGEMGDSHMGLQARLMSQALRKLTPIVHKSKTILIFINQVRATINALPFAEKETTTGGKALKFYASLRLEVRKIASLKKNDVHVGNKIVVKVAKNKVAPPFKRAEVDLLFKEGISGELDLLDAGIACGLIGKSGSWLTYENNNIGQGREQAYSFLKSNTAFTAQLREKVRITLGHEESAQETVQDAHDDIPAGLDQVDTPSMQVE